ncbi:MAG: hypothetical protein CMJ78_03700 [Planctomycetaceae bacterium]|nr:hypothetical protein [Planctomycetaceae bacterium]
MPTVVISPEAFYKIDTPFVATLNEAGFDVRYPSYKEFTRGLDGDEKTIEELSGAVAVIAGGEFLTPNVIENLPDLRIISRCGVGYDRVDVPAATAKGIPVTITPTANHRAVAELTMALLFGVTKQTVLNDHRVRSGQWTVELSKPIRDNTFGLVGLGRIGRSTALCAKALGMKLIATEMYPDEDFVCEHEVELVDFDTLLSRSDFLSVHCPLNDETRGMFNKDVFSRMKLGSVFLNTARGGLVVETDLIDALNSGHLSGAGLDVFEQEPPDVANPLFQLNNVVCTPHIGGTDERSMMDMGIECADVIIRLSRNDWPGGAVVNDELSENWKW